MFYSTLPVRIFLNIAYNKLYDGLINDVLIRNMPGCTDGCPVVVEYKCFETCLSKMPVLLLLLVSKPINFLAEVTLITQ